MSGNKHPPIEDVGDADRWLIVGFIVCLLFGLGVLGWHYRQSDKSAPICASSEARCGDHAEPAQ